MGNKIVMAVLAAMALGSTALADAPDIGMKNYDPESINSSKSSNRETNLGRPDVTEDSEPTQRDARQPGASYSGTSRTTATGPVRANEGNSHARGHKHRPARKNMTSAPRSNDEVLGTGAK